MRHLNTENRSQSGAGFQPADRCSWPAGSRPHASVLCFLSSVLCLSLALGCTALARAASISGEVARVDDGDTLIVLDAERRAHTVRLLGVDAPELGQESGEAARSNLSRLAQGRTVLAECRTALPPSTRLCVVRIGGQDLGLTQIVEGMAWRSRAHAAQQTRTERADYDQAEFMAKIRRRGLWNATNPTPPWDWRAKRRR